MHPPSANARSPRRSSRTSAEVASLRRGGSGTVVRASLFGGIVLMALQLTAALLIPTDIEPLPAVGAALQEPGSAGIETGSLSADGMSASGLGDVSTQVVLLHNGRVIEGVVSREPDRWSVEIGANSRVRLELHQVDLIARDHREMRQLLQQRTGREQVGKRIEIVRYCLRHGLLDEAREEIAWLGEDGLAPDEIDRLTRQWEAARRRADGFERPESALADGRTASRENARSGAPGGSDGGADDSATGNAASGSTASDNTGSREVRQVSAELEPIDTAAFGVFVQRIQPPLIAGCAAADCHGPRGTNGFRLQRLELGAQPTRRMSEANYREVRRLALTARDGETLADWGLKPHGGRRDAVWTHAPNRSDDQRAWQEWMRRIAPTGVDSTVADGASETEASSSGTDTDDVRRVVFSEGGRAEGADRLRRPPTTHGDPYDPELYRRYREWKRTVGNRLPASDPTNPPGDELPPTESGTPSPLPDSGFE